MRTFRLRAAGLLVAVLGVSLGLAASPATADPSFSCSDKLSETEAVICSDAKLSRLDTELAKTYERALDDASDRRQQSLRNEQRDWVQRRNGCRFDKDCIRRAYSDRLGELDGERHDASARPDDRHPSRPLNDDMVGSTFLQHNGSGLQIFNGRHDHVEFRYTSVRPGLSAREGEVLFRGVMSEGGRIAGTAFVFKQGCPPAPYDVSGTQTARRIVLRGPAPVHEPGSCDIATYDDSVASARLEFTIAE
jgi:uncharacterized protein YecT (DUF1311 family)